MSDSSSDSEFETKSTISVKSRGTKGSCTYHACPYPDCEKFFSRPYRLQSHILTHTGERPFKCKELGCDKSYTREIHLKRHEKNSHSKIQVKQESESRIPCSHCHLTFANKHSLKKHCVKHHNLKDNSLKTYECGACDKTFFSKIKRNAHQKQEHPDCSEILKKFVCKICSKRFSSNSKLQAHDKQHQGYQ